jgi:hypothetical protein
VGLSLEEGLGGVRTRRRGWITVAELSMTVVNPRENDFRWRTSEDDARDAEEAEVERLREEGKTVASIGWSDPNGGKTIEHQAGPEPSSED